MAKLIVYQKDNEIATLELEPGKEYSVGRSADNDLCLNDEGLSRQHFKISYEANKWIVRLIARYGDIIYNNSPQKSFDLKSGDTFAVAIYIFKFESEPVDAGAETVPLQTDDHTDAIVSVDDKTFVADKTSVNWSAGVPFLKITYSDKHSETLRLEGEYWVIGRDKNNEIFIDDPKSSRTHAEISKAGSIFTLRDLNSSNGVTFNGHKLEKNIPTPLMSGDEFRIGNTIFYFEVRDPHFEDKMKNLPVEHSSTSWGQTVSNHLGFPTRGTAAVRLDQKLPIYKRPITFVITAVILLSFVFSSEDPKPKRRVLLSEKQMPSVNKELTSEQKKFVETTFKLAEQFFMSQRYELALTEIDKIHQIIPQYENSREIEALSKEAIELKMTQKEIEMREQQEQETQTRIRTIVNECEDRFQSGTTSPDAIRDCLVGALDLDPGNVDAQALISRAEDAQRTREIQMQNQAAYNGQVQSGKTLFSKAMRFKNDGKTREAIETFQRHISMAYPDPENLKIKSKIELQDLKQELQTKVVAYKKEAADFKSQEKLKEALAKLKKGLELDPKNSELIELQGEYTVYLRKNMKALYEDSVLEENLGNIEAAKEKWKKIKSEDIKTGDYYIKARSKLKKYGLE